MSGRVQGVWYRATTQEKARALGLKGWVRNLADGRVELMACGAEDKVQTLKDWFWQGPPGADVTDVICNENPLQTFEDFDVV